MRRIDIHLPTGDLLDLSVRIIKSKDPVDYAVFDMQQVDRKMISVFLRDGTEQALMDALQDALKDCATWRIMMLPIEATAPKLDEPTEETAKTQKKAIREELYADVSSDATFGTDFAVLVLLSTIVAAIGMNANGVAAVIGAMVIAPLLGPILGFCLGVALGDLKLLRKAAVTLGLGIAIALAASFVLSFVLRIDLQSRELISRAEVRLDGVALAMAAGGAAALSLARGQASALVGVMVAAALLPPGAAIGLFAGEGRGDLALRSALLLILNIAALILASLVVFRVKGIKPRRGEDSARASRAMWINLSLTAALLAIAAVLILVFDLGAKLSVG